MPSATAPPSVKYNVRRGCSNRNNLSSATNTADVCARYKKKLRAVLRKNKLLAQALEAAKAKISELESAGARQQKVDSLALPQIKNWLDMGAQYMHTAVNNHARAIRLLQDIMTPDLDITLTGFSDPDDSGSQNRRRSLHPPGRQRFDDFGNITMIPEEGESMDESQQGVLDKTLVEQEDDPGSKVTIRRKTRSARSGHGASFSEEPSSIFDEPQVPTFKVVDEKASNLLTEVTGQEKKVVCATSVVLPPTDKVKGPSVHEYSAAFSYRPKIPRTPSNVDKESSSFFDVEGVSGSPELTRTTGRLSDVPLQPWPRNPVGRARSTRRSSLPVAAGPNYSAAPPQAQQSNPHVTRRSSRLSELRLSDFDMGFMESPKITAPPMSSYAGSPEKAAFAVPQDSPNKAKVPRKKSCKKPQAPGGSAKASRLTFVVTKPAEKAEQEGTCDVPSSIASTSAPSRASGGNLRLSKHPVAKKSRGKAGLELEPPRRSGTLLNSEPMDVSASSSADEDDATRTSSGRASRRAAKTTSYKEPSLHVKLRRP